MASTRRRLDWRVAAVGVPVLLAACLGLYLWFASARMHRAAAALQDGRLDEAEAAFDRASRGWYGRARALEGLGVVALRRGKDKDAEALLRQAREAGGGHVLADPVAELRELIAAGRYAPALDYASYLSEEVEDPEVLLLRAVALAGLQRRNDATAALEEYRARAGPVGAGAREETLRRLTAVLDDLGKGRRYCLLDREGDPVLGYDIGTREPVQGVWPVATLLGGPPAAADAGFLGEDDLHNEVVLTISGNAQKAADQALGRYAGGFVLLDVHTGEILAAVSHTKDDEPSWPALRHLYEPGSIVKLFTHAAALRQGSDVERLFPLDCKGNDFVLDGKILYDWKPHGRVNDVVEATAVSCNTAFGRMGILVGQRALADELRHWGFGEEVPRGLVEMRTGKAWEGFLQGDYELARAAIGLDHVTMTVLHAAMAAAAIADDGVMMRPRLLLERRNVLGRPYDKTSGAEWIRAADPKVVEQLRAGMRAAVERPDGTAHRLADARVSLGVKTGTAGEREDGLDAVLIGFLPADDPEVAFAMVAEGGGLAGIEGARIVHAFLDSWYARGGGVGSVVRDRRD